MTISRSQLRAARIMLCLSQEELAALTNVGVATIRRFESGSNVTMASLQTLRKAVEAAGAVILDEAEIGGREIGEGVALAPLRKLPTETVERIERRTVDDGAPKKSGRPFKRKS